jgi:HSP20 family protein
MNLTRWSPFTKFDPFKEMEELTNRLAPWFSTELRPGGNQNEMMTVTQWVPLVDITEDDKEYLIKTELPEVKKEDVKVTVENGRLSISGERKFAREEKDKKYHRLERSYGSFLRSFTLPDVAKADQVMAEFKDGVLLVHVPKTTKPTAKNVEVNVQ